MYQKNLHRFASLTAACTLVLIAAGGLVTSTGSGLSVPDWPLSYGQFFPPMIGGIRFEHSHRLIAATVGLLTLVLTLWLLLKEKRAWVKGVGVLALFMVLAQAILGGITVKYLLPTAVSVAHACLGQTFFAVVAALALFTSKEWLEEPVVGAKRAATVQRLFLTTLVFVYLQLIFGAMVRHTPNHTGLKYHFITAFLILVHAVFIIPKVTKEKEMQRLFLKPVMFLATFVCTQIFLGLASYIYKVVMAPGPMPLTAEVLFTTAHQTNGALILATTVVLSLRSFRLLRRTRESNLMKIFSNYLELTKPRLTLLVLATTFLGYFMASRTAGAAASLFQTARLVHTLLAAALIGAGINALNQYFERSIDAKMKRTQNRPVPSGRVSPRNALLFGAILSFSGAVYLFIATNVLAGCLGLATIVSYVLIYTPLKQKTAFNTLAGAVPGALPCILGWAAATSALPRAAWSLFLILFFWQLPHFFAIAWVYKEDYDRSGLKMLTQHDSDGRSTGKKIILGALLLFPVTLLPVWAGIGERIYLVTALAAGALFIFASISIYRQKLSPAKKFVSLSIYYLLALIVAMVADKI